jgi:hypothetical protein
MREQRPRFWIQSGLAVLSGLLCVLTLVRRDWIEAIFGVDPDAHSGALEWLIVVVLVVFTALFTARARSDWRGAAAVADRR